MTLVTVLTAVVAFVVAVTIAKKAIVKINTASAERKAEQIKMDYVWLWFTYCVWKEEYSNEFGFVHYFNEYAMLFNKPIAHNAAINIIVEMAYDKLESINKMDELGIPYNTDEKKIAQDTIRDYINGELEI